MLWKTIGRTSCKEFSNALGRSVPWFDFTHHGYHFSSHGAKFAFEQHLQHLAWSGGFTEKQKFLSKRASELFVFHWSGVIRRSGGIGPSDHSHRSFDSFWLWQATCCPPANAPSSCCCGQRPALAMFLTTVEVLPVWWVCKSRGGKEKAAVTWLVAISGTFETSDPYWVSWSHLTIGPLDPKPVLLEFVTHTKRDLSLYFHVMECKLLRVLLVFRAAGSRGSPAGAEEWSAPAGHCWPYTAWQLWAVWAWLAAAIGKWKVWHCCHKNNLSSRFQTA